MPERTLEQRIDLTKSTFEVAREAMVFVLLMAVIVVPRPVGEHLAKMGFARVTTPFGDIDVSAMLDTTKAIATSVSASSQTILALRDQLAERRLTMPTDKRGMVDSALRMLDSTASRLGRADSAVTQQLLAQQTALAQSGIQAAPNTGWVYLGRLDSSRTNWLSRGPEALDSVGADLKRGDHVVLKGLVLLRGDPPTAERTRGPVVGVLPPNARALVDSLVYVKAKSVAWGVWVKISVMSDP